MIRPPRDYFGITKRKWRGKIIKGIEQKIKDKKIERTKFAIDTLGEKRQLSAAREIKRLKKRVVQRSKNKPIKLKSTRLIKRRR